MDTRHTDWRPFTDNHTRTDHRRYRIDHHARHSGTPKHGPRRLPRVHTRRERRYGGMRVSRRTEGGSHRACQCGCAPPWPGPSPRRRPRQAHTARSTLGDSTGGARTAVGAHLVHRPTCTSQPPTCRAALRDADGRYARWLPIASDGGGSQRHEVARAHGPAQCDGQY